MLTDWDVTSTQKWDGFQGQDSVPAFERYAIAVSRQRRENASEPCAGTTALLNRAHP